MMESEKETMTPGPAKLSGRMIEACVEAAMDYLVENNSSQSVRPQSGGVYPEKERKKNVQTVESRQRWAGELRQRMREAISKRPQLLEDIRRASRLRVTGDENIRIRDHVSHKVKKRVKTVRRRVGKYVKRPPVVKTVDKFLFTTGVAWVAATEYVLLCTPSRLDLWYVASIGPLLAHRQYTYRKAGFIYFTYDFCYWTNLMCFIWMITRGALLRSSLRSSITFVYGDYHKNENTAVDDTFFRVIFCLCNGPLISAVVVWRNSFIFHSLDHVCSTMLHTLPPIWTFTVRWAHYYTREARSSPFYILHTFFLALLNYFVWQILYLIKTEWLDRNYLRNSPHQYTSLRWMVKDSRGTMYRLCKATLVSWNLMRRDEEFNETAWRTKITFWLGQLMYTMITLLPVPFMWYSHTCHTICLLLMFLVAIYNGASYYIEIFSQRYNQKFEKLNNEDTTENDTDLSPRASSLRKSQQDNKSTTNSSNLSNQQQPLSSSDADKEPPSSQHEHCLLSTDDYDDDAYLDSPNDSDDSDDDNETTVSFFDDDYLDGHHNNNNSSSSSSILQSPPEQTHSPSPNFDKRD
mmetsp:Transcript_23218/g.30061  ORF Transcript_23218/g.30061 Transcript_23218/m.30061 type:complete len:577 (-) Transcript_23218:23-1753(-)